MPRKRFEIYRNNVVAGLTRALAIRFPATEKIVGEEFFAAMARAFVLRHPPTSPVLLNYGDDFSAFVEGFAPARTVPYLSDVIRLENVQVHAYHAADAEPIDPQSLAHLSEPDLESLRFVFHPSFHVVRSTFPVVTIWAMNTGEIPLRPIEEWTAEDALVVRPQLAVTTHRLPPGGAAFLNALAEGATLHHAAENALDDAGGFDLTANITGLLGSGAVISASCDGLPQSK